jgi:predicted short-subunit dehydrogenase-like oxidoreductase (DUF2520 family)
MTHNRRIGILGSGRMARALGRALWERGQPVTAVAGRSLPRAEEAALFIGGGAEAVSPTVLPSLADSILIAVSDGALREAADLLRAAGMSAGAVLHTSGVHGPEVLDSLAGEGVSCGALHPLQTLSASESSWQGLLRAAFALSAEGSAALWGEEIVRSLEGRLLRINRDGKPLYHAAAVLASNYVVSLLDAALELMAAAGVPREEALPALAPLVRKSLENCLAEGPEKALTGPVDRGDVSTVELHLEAFRSARLPERVERLYKALGHQALDMAGRKGLAATSLTRLGRLFDNSQGEASKGGGDKKERP